MFLHREYGYTKAEKTREAWVGSGRVRSGRPDPHLPVFLYPSATIPVFLSCFFFLQAKRLEQVSCVSCGIYAMQELITCMLCPCAMLLVVFRYQMSGGTPISVKIS